MNNSRGETLYVHFVNEAEMLKHDLLDALAARGIHTSTKKMKRNPTVDSATLVHKHSTSVTVLVDQGLWQHQLFVDTVDQGH